MRGVKIFVGVLSFVPMFFCLLLAAFLIYMLIIKPNPPDDGIVSAMDYLQDLAGFINLVLLFFFIAHACKNKRSDRATSLLFGFGIITIPIYWYRYIWKEQEGMPHTYAVGQEAHTIKRTPNLSLTGKAMAQSNNSPVLGGIAIAIGFMLAMGGASFLMVGLMTDFPGLLMVSPAAQLVLGLLGAATGFLLLRGHMKAKLVLFGLAIAVIANLGLFFCIIVFMQTR